MWEGFDEWAHFAYVEHLAVTGALPTRSDTVPTDVAASLQLVAMPYGQAGFTSHDKFWSLDHPLQPQADAPTYSQYEAQQPPLYYVLMAFPYTLAAQWSLPARLLLLRILGLLMVSVAIPLSYSAARLALGTERLALMVPVAFAALPGLMIDVCRVANDCFAIPLATALLLISLRLTVRNVGLRAWMVAGLILGALLVTKAYALVFLGLLPLVGFLQRPNLRNGRKPIAGYILAAAIAISISGWWYWLAWQLTGTISGEQLDAAASRFSLFQKLITIPRINWLASMDSAAFTHIWVGGWSFLVLRSWMYRVFEVVAISAALGLVLYFWKRRLANKRMIVVTAFYGLFCVAVAYHVVVIVLAGRPPAALGWYFNVVIVAELLMMICGIRYLAGRRWTAPVVATVICFTIFLDLYTVHFMLVPYYTGIITHIASGALPAVRPGQLTNFHEILRRISFNRPPIITPASVSILWAMYFCGTCALAGLAVKLARWQVSEK
jgi:hypothetical protein